jgi:hypothetical protein
MTTTARRIVVTGLACLLLASPAAAAQPMPSEVRVPAQSEPQDLRSPDTRDAAETPPQDLRSPDTRDAADPTPPVFEPASAPAESVAVASPGTDWALITLAASGYLLAVAVVALSALRGRRRLAA